jgi:hypothetical protein
MANKKEKLYGRCEKVYIKINEKKEENYMV